MIIKVLVFGIKNQEIISGIQLFSVLSVKVKKHIIQMIEKIGDVIHVDVYIDVIEKEVQLINV